MKSNIVNAVLKAADEWVSAQEALVAAKQVSKETEAEQEAIDIAGSLLVVAVTRWRSERGAWPATQGQMKSGGLTVLART